MLGARSALETAVGSRAELNTTSTSTTNAATESIATRERNSTTKSLAATAQAWRRRSGDRIAILLPHLLRSSAGARREMHEAAGAHERDVGREPGAFLHVVRHEHGGPSGRSVLPEEAAERFGRDAIEARERLVEQQDRRVVCQRARNGDALHEPPGQRPHGPIRVLLESQPRQEFAGRRHVVERCPEAQVLAYGELRVQLRLMADPADRATAAVDLRAAALGLDQTGENFEKGGLPRPVGAEHGECLTGLYAEGNVVESPDRTEAVPQRLSPQHRSRRRARSIRTV